MVVEEKNILLNHHKTNLVVDMVVHLTGEVVEELHLLGQQQMQQQERHLVLVVVEEFTTTEQVR